MFFLMLSALPRKINGSMAVCETVNGARFPCVRIMWGVCSGLRGRGAYGILRARLPRVGSDDV